MSEEPGPDSAKPPSSGEIADGGVGPDEQRGLEGLHEAETVAGLPAGADGEQRPPAAGAPAAAAKGPTAAKGTRVATDRGVNTVELRDSQLPSSSAFDGGRFTPGQIIDARYRIVSLVGRGGMGEVYRADDLKLGEVVALKFLPPALSDDSRALARLHEEVRLARQISHRNIVRVHDIGEADGQPYLSMEFVDGEDLASLLRRIGRLPEGKALEIAIQMCVGLAAAHEQGVLHRDLKPANVMIDGRGVAKISDFGLAVLGGADEAVEHGGTPAYMAPEQLARAEVSVASDIYALGLILFEMLSGERPFRGPGDQQILERLDPDFDRLRRALDNVNPAKRETVIRCLRPQASDRFESALALGSALGGADQLFPIGRGETPSPDLLARAPVDGRISRARAVGLFLLVLVGMVVLVDQHARISLQRIDGLPLRPEVLEHEARELISAVAGTERAQAAGRGWFRVSPLAAVGREDLATIADWEERAQFWPSAMEFVLRVGDGARPREWWNFAVDVEDPPLGATGTATVRLDSRGRLLQLVISADALSEEESRPPVRAGPEVWSALFEASGLDPEQMVEVAGTAGDAASDEQNPGRSELRWAGRFPDARGAAVEVVAAPAGETYPGESRTVEWEVRLADQEGSFIEASPGAALLVFLVILLIGGALAGRNHRRGRADASGATKVAIVTGSCAFLNLALTNRGLPLLAFETVFGLLGLGLILAAGSWVSYMAIEPLVRRHLPRSHVSWTRLIEGRFGDPLVGRDLLMGMGGGVLLFMLNLLSAAAASRHMGFQLLINQPAGAPALEGAVPVLGALFNFPLLIVPFGILFIVMIPHTVFRHPRTDRIAAVAGVLLVVAFSVAWNGPSIWSVLVGLVAAATARRAGLVGLFGLSLLGLGAGFQTLVGNDLSSWWTPASLIHPVVVATLALFAARSAAVGTRWVK